MCQLVLLVTPIWGPVQDRNLLHVPGGFELQVGHHRGMIRSASPTTNTRDVADRPARSPADRQAAVFDIGQALQALDLQEWSWTLLDWLRLYDGFEQYLPPHDDPLLSTARVFASVVRRRANTRVIVSDIVQSLEEQPFMYWHAQWVDAQATPVGMSWKPLGQPSVSFWEYLDQRPDGAQALRAIQLESIHVDSQTLRNWLVAGYLRYVLPHRKPTS